MRHGCDDVFIAYPLWLDDDRARRLRDLADLGRVAIAVDSVEGAANAGRRLGGSDIEVLVEVDSGHHRTGVPAAEAGPVGVAAERSGVRVRGAFTFPGHGYSPGQAARVARAERDALTAAATSLRSHGLRVDVLSGGSTPTLTASLGTDLATPPDRADGRADGRADDWADDAALLELRPGVYVFGDAQQWELGASPSDIALTCSATVVSHAGGRLVLDAGSKVLGADRAAYATGYGRLLEHPEARVVMLSEHHAVVDLDGAPLPPLGSRVSVVPNHVCAAVNLADELWVDEAGGLRPWPVSARGCNA